MGRGGGGGFRGGGGGFRSAPRVRRTTPTPKPAPAPSPAAPGDQKNGASTSVGYVPSNVADGTTWGAGNAMGHRLADSLAGPRTIQVVSEDEPQAATPAFAAFDHEDDDSCGAHNKAFADCIYNYGSDISRCQFYLDLLNQCRRPDSTFA